MINCLSCQTALQATHLTCVACGLDYSGHFQLPRLARLPTEQQHLVEQIILVGGNLKEVAASLEISYPTLRKRVDNLVSALKTLQQTDVAETNEILKAVEAGQLSAEAASRRIRELNGAA